MKDSTNAKGIFYLIFQKRHILASADTLKCLTKRFRSCDHLQSDRKIENV